MSAPSEGLGGGRGAAGREEERRAIAEHNALAAVFEVVAAASAAGVLSTPAQWAEQGLVPEHMSGEDLEMMVYDHLMAWYEEHGRPDEGGSFLASDPLAPGRWAKGPGSRERPTRLARPRRSALGSTALAKRTRRRVTSLLRRSRHPAVPLRRTAASWWRWRGS